MEIAKFEFSLFGINTYVVSDPATGKCAIVDPGMINKPEEDALRSYIKRKGLTPECIIATHLHIDHAAGIASLKKEYHIPLLAHKADEFLGTRVEDQARMFGIYEQVSDVRIDRYLEPGEVIRIGEGELKVIHVPGHSPGSVALYDEKDGFVITGDALFRSSVGRADLPGGDMDTLINAIKAQLLPLPDVTVVYPGHGPATTIGLERMANPYLL